MLKTNSHRQKTKTLIFFLFLFFPLFLIAQESTIYTIETVPNPKDQGNDYVSDPGQVLDGADIARLNAIAAEIEDSSTAQVAVVVLPTIGDDNPKQFATALFNQWGIGQAGKDNGLLIFTVMDQRRTEFETGYGMEGILPDVVCYRIGMQILVPYFQEGKYGEGLVATLGRIQEIFNDPEYQAELQAEALASKRKRAQKARIPFIILFSYLALALIVTSIILYFIIRHRTGKDELYDKYKKIDQFHTILLAIFFPVPYLLVYFWVGRVLRKLRNYPRFSKENGKPMRKLEEDEEDDYLEKGQITEEDIKSVDYDVWVTDNADDILILRYERRFSKYKKCPKCSFKAYFRSHSNVIRSATYSSSGSREVIHLCKNCNYRNRTVEIIPMKTRSSGGSGGGGGGGSWGGGSSGAGGAGVSW